MAAAKARLLLLSARKVAVVALSLDVSFADLVSAGQIDHRTSDFHPDLIKGRPLIIVATGDEAADKTFATEASRLGIPVNVPDRPELCTFFLPAIVDRSPVMIAISTGGAAPVLTQKLRAQLEDLLHPRLGRVATMARELRDQVTRTVPDSLHRKAFWRRFFNGPAASTIQAGDEQKAASIVARELNEAGASDVPAKVYLVGAGPGDPDLLTVKALRVIREADAILYDDLAGREILQYARRECRLIYVGKRGGATSTPQSYIHDQLVQLAKPGTIIVRLKGGDPFLFGRGGEEISELHNAGIACEVIPGISAAIAGAASNLMPLTDRRLASGVTFLTGHAADHGQGRDKARDGEIDFGSVDLAAMRDGNHTLAIYMGIRNGPAIGRALIEAGWSGQLPVLIAENISRPNERAINTTVHDLANNFTWLGIEGPAIIYAGNCAGLIQKTKTPAHARYEQCATGQTT